MLRPWLRELLLDHLTELVDAYAVHQELDAGLHPVLAQIIGGVEHPEHRLADLEVVLLRHELVQGGRYAGHYGETAADHYLEPAFHLAVHLLEPGHKTDVVDAGHGAVLLAAGEGGLGLAGHGLGHGVTQEVAGVGSRVGSYVKRLVGADAREGAAGDVAHRVAACLAGGQAHLADGPHGFRRPLQGQEVELDVLPRGGVALLEGRDLPGDVSQRLKLVRVQTSNGYLHSQHLGVRLSLAVDPLLQAEGHKCVGVPLSLDKPLHLLLEIVDLIHQDGKYTLLVYLGLAHHAPLGYLARTLQLWV